MPLVQLILFIVFAVLTTLGLKRITVT